MKTNLRASMAVAFAAAGLLTAGVLIAETTPAPAPAPAPARAKQAAGAQSQKKPTGKANGSYPIVVGKNAVEVNDNGKRKAALTEVAIDASKGEYKVLSVNLPAQVNEELGIEGVNTVVLPKGAESPKFDVTNGEVSLSWDEEPEGDGDVDAAPNAAEAQKASCVDGYHKSGKWCMSRERTWSLSNNTAWFRGYNQYMYWFHDGDKKYNYWGIKREGTCKSKGLWEMSYCGVGSKKRTSIYQKILKFSPNQDTKGDCRSLSLGVSLGVVSLGGDYQHCEESDINFPNRTHFSNYWRGAVHREERAVAYQYIVQTKQGERPRFTLWTPYCAGLAACL